MADEVAPAATSPLATAVAPDALAAAAAAAVFFFAAVLLV